MKLFTKLGTTLVLSIALAGITAAQSDTQLTATVKEFIPAGTVFAHKPLKGIFAEGAAAKIVALYRKDATNGGYDGVVLFPAGAGKYEPNNLPQPEFTWSYMKPIAVFFDNADSDPAKELFIIDEYMTGIGPEGARSFHRTRVYDWRGGHFVHDELLSDEIGDLATAAAVRKRLPVAIKQAQARFEPLDAEKMNAKLAAGNANGPLAVVAAVIEPFEEMMSRTVSIKADSVEDAEALMVIVTDDGYADDSVRGAQYRMRLYKDNAGKWRVSEASKGWRCQQGRGHQDFSSKPCV